MEQAVVSKDAAGNNVVIKKPLSTTAGECFFLTHVLASMGARVKWIFEKVQQPV
jgi:hypothetical protein